MNQAVLGAAIPFLVAALAYAVRGGRASWALLVATPIGMAAGALWAVAPDIPRALGLSQLYLRLAQDPRMDVFFWHYTIDRIETDSTLWNVGVIIMAAALLVAAWRELAHREASASTKG